MKTIVTVRTISSNVIEYDVAMQEPWEKKPEVSTFHANRYGTFAGPHSIGAQRVDGPDKTAWRETNVEIAAALKAKYKNAYVDFVDRDKGRPSRTLFG